MYSIPYKISFIQIQFFQCFIILYLSFSTRMFVHVFWIICWKIQPDYVSYAALHMQTFKLVRGLFLTCLIVRSKMGPFHNFQWLKIYFILLISTLKLVLVGCLFCWYVSNRLSVFFKTTQCRKTYVDIKCLWFLTYLSCGLLWMLNAFLYLYFIFIYVQSSSDRKRADDEQPDVKCRRI